MDRAESVAAGLWILAICAYDLHELRVPNWLLVLGLLLAGAYAGTAHEVSPALWGLAVGLATMLFVSQFWPFGPGDQKLAGAIGAFIGSWGVLLAVGIAVGLAVGWITWRRPRQEAFPFSPFLAVGAVVAYGLVG